MYLFFKVNQETIAVIQVGLWKQAVTKVVVKATVTLILFVSLQFMVTMMVINASFIRRIWGARVEIVVLLNQINIMCM